MKRSIFILVTVMATPVYMKAADLPNLGTGYIELADLPNAGDLLKMNDLFPADFTPKPEKTHSQICIPTNLCAKCSSALPFSYRLASRTKDVSVPIKEMPKKNVTFPIEIKGKNSDKAKLWVYDEKGNFLH